MEEIITQAFLHVEVIDLYVQKGCNDLVGPDGNIILPCTWETTVEPDMQINIHMWPIPEAHTSG